MTIDRVTMFKCPETGKLFKTERGAKNSAKRAKEAKELSLLATGFDPSQFEAQRDYVRLNATTPEHIIDLVTQKAEEFWGFKVTRFEPGNVIQVIDRGGNGGKEIIFGNCYVEVDSSGSCRLAYMAEQARISKDKWYRVPSIYDLLFGSMGFRGFGSPGGTTGSCGSSPWPLRMPLMAKLEEFPLINQSYQEWITHKSEFDKYEHKKSVVTGYGRCLARSSTEYEKLKELRDYHERCVELVRDSLVDLETYYTEGLLKKWVGINPPVVKNFELWGMFAK